MQKLLHSLMFIEEQLCIPKSKLECDAINVNDNFRRQVGTPLMPSTLPTGLSFTSLRSLSIESNSSFEVIYQTQGVFHQISKHREAS